MKRSATDNLTLALARDDHGIITMVEGACDAPQTETLRIIVPTPRVDAVLSARKHARAGCCRGRACSRQRRHWHSHRLHCHHSSQRVIRVECHVRRLSGQSRKLRGSVGESRRLVAIEVASSASSNLLHIAIPIAVMRVVTLARLTCLVV